MTAASCQTCRNLRVQIGQANGDLAAAVRKAINRPTAYQLAQVERMKARKAETKKTIAQHELTCEELVNA
ncbi:hypothetical protein [Micromonospora sp. WMMD736]|uniref:hypothetical protein n=1 Tax=Micromonospora sp. WMMD736 TaxID=3404112 RepID=UPI003B9529E4